MKMIIGLVIGYFVGIISCLFQVIRTEKKYKKQIKDILDDK